MCVSLKILQRFIFSGLCLWLILLATVVERQDHDPASLRWHEKDLHSIRQRRRPQHRHHHNQPQQPLHHLRRDLEGPPFHSNDNAGGSNNVTLSLPTVVDKRSHKFGRMPNSRSRKWHHRRRQDDDDSLDDITFNSSKSNMKLPLPVIVMGFPVSFYQTLPFTRKLSIRHREWMYLSSYAIFFGAPMCSRKRALLRFLRFSTGKDFHPNIGIAANVSCNECVDQYLPKIN
jgi:hypothetical protein